MRILLTRPRAQAEVTAQALRRCGHEVLLAPMLDIHPLAEPPQAGGEDHFAAVLFTSTNGVRFGARRLPSRDFPAFCVGRRTAEAARAAGFASVIHAGGDGRDLADLIIERIAPADGPLLHLCGHDHKSQPGTGLREAGFELHELPVYEARPAAGLPRDVAARIETGDIDLVLVYSERAARRFRELATERLRDGQGARLMAGALSSAMAEPLRGLVGRIVVADRPAENALMAALARVTGDRFPGQGEAKTSNGR